MDYPMCEECDVEMVRYYDAPDTGKSGFSCMSCGWSHDDPEPNPEWKSPIPSDGKWPVFR